MKHIHKEIDKNFIIIIALGVLLFIPFLGRVHLFDWDEINFAESAREMILTGDYLTVQINFTPFWEKPPLFIWMQVLSMKLFGINEFAARFPNAICGIVTLLVLYGIGKKLFNKRFGLIWVLAYTGSVLPFFYFKSGIIDPWFNLFIFTGLYYLLLYTSSEFEGNKIIQALLSGFFIGLGVLTKGPVAFLIYAITLFVLLILKKFKVQFKVSHILLFTITLAITGGLWFILQIAIGNYTIVTDFISYQVRLFQTKDAGHGGFFLYHFVVLLIGVFPASIFALPSFRKVEGYTAIQQYFKMVMVILLLTILVVFTIVKTKIVHYSSLAYFPVTFLAAWYLNKLIDSEIEYKKWIGYLLFPIGSFFGMAVIALPLIDRYKNQIIELNIINDPFAVGNLQAEVGWTGYEALIGVLLITSLLVFNFLRRKSIYLSVIQLFASTSIFVYLTLIVIVPRIEGYSQRAAVDFFKSLQGKDAYIEPIGYKSYAHFFYAQKQKPTNNLSFDKNWLLSGEIDKDAYFSVKNFRLKRYLDSYPDLEIINEENGFVFLKRPKKTHQDDK